MMGKYVSDEDSMDEGRSECMTQELAIIEIALNGKTPKASKFHVLRRIGEIIADGIQCLDLMAAIVHNHGSDLVLGKTVYHDVKLYVGAWKVILAKWSKAIPHPTMGTGGPHTTIE